MAHRVSAESQGRAVAQIASSAAKRAVRQRASNEGYEQALHVDEISPDHSQRNNTGPVVSPAATG